MWYWVFKFVLLGPVARWYLRLRWEGRENLPRSGAFVVAPNHLTMVDPVGISMGVPRKVIFIAKTKYYTGRSAGARALAWFLRAIGQVPVDVSGASAAEPALVTARALLEAGGVWAIFPEGTRSPDGRLYRGRTGIMRVALPMGVPVVPVGVRGTREVVLPGRPGWRRLRGRARVTITYGAPLDLSPWRGREEDPQAWREATDALMERIAALSGQERVFRYATPEELGRRDQG